MTHWKTLMAAAVSAFAAMHAGAAPSAAEAAQLGKTLTPMGSEKAGNADSSIPEWTGGLCKPPAGYKPLNGVSGSPYVDPFADEKPLYTVNASNVDKYADKLDDGQKNLIKLYPQSYRIDVYPAHRTACFPDWVYDNTVKRVMSPKLVGDAPGLEGAHAQIPFPIPKTGQEALYNDVARYRPVFYGGDFHTWLMDAAGNKTLITRATVRYRNDFWDNTKTQAEELSALLNTNNSPASKSGSMDMRVQWLRMDQKDPRAWSYTPGQRRVRLAPEFTYDTVAAQYGGVIVFDEISGFDGKMDRFDFKLTGKKELLVPYNAYKLVNAPLDQQLTKNHHSPDLVRFELHRVWVVEATRKAGARHVYSKKVFYIDEDSWQILSYQSYDEAGKLYRAQFFPIWQAYDIQTPTGATALLAYDFVKNGWALGSIPVDAGWRKIDALPVNYFTPDAMAAMGVR
jgi:hypothetical protein